jgi:hypothetical protein
VVWLARLLSGRVWLGQCSQFGEPAYRFDRGSALQLLHAAVDVHLDGARADEQGAASLPAGVSLRYQLHDVQFAAGEACGHAARVRVAAWCVAELAERRRAAFAQVAGTELVGGGVRGVQQFPRVRVVAEPGSRGCSGRKNCPPGNRSASPCATCTAKAVLPIPAIPPIA